MSYSQFGQDLWVLNYFNKGIFIDVGFHDGLFISNTRLLEENGWSGIGIDPFPKNFESRINTKIEVGCVYKYDTEIEFTCADDYGGITEYIESHKSNPKVIDGKKIKISARTLEYFLTKNNIPSKIEYLSIDTEGSEYEIFSTFPFHKYVFGCITCEHNNEPKARQKIREILEQNGYLFDKQLNIDDCYIHKTVKDKTF